MKTIAIITGASSGMGKEFALQIAEKNIYDEIWIIARRQERLTELSSEINAKTGKETAIPLALDISGKKGVHALKEKIEAEKDMNIGLLINNAGFGTYGPFDETDVEKEMDMVDLNCTALTGICGIAIPYMKPASIIINTASLASFLPLGNFAVYGATKAYVLSFSMALSAELKSKEISVTALCPGPVSTEFANVASNGKREKVKHGVDTTKVVKHCLKKAYSRKRTAIYAFKWKFKAAASRFVGRYTGAWFTYKFCKRPH